MISHRKLPISLHAQIIIAVLGDFFLFYDEGIGGGRSGRCGRCGDRGGLGLEPGLEEAGCGWQVVFINGASLGAEVEAVVFHLEKGDPVRYF